MKKNIIIDAGKYELYIDEEDIVCIDGFIPVYYKEEINDNKKIIITGILDKDYKQKVPFRKEEIGIDEEENLTSDLFNNGICAYRVYDDFYLIDLNNVSFVKQNNHYIPKNYIIKFKGFYSLDDKHFIIYEDSSAYLYDIINKKKLTFDCNYMQLKDENNINEIYGVLESSNGYVSPYYIKLLFNLDGKINNEVMLNETLAAILPNDLKSKKELIKYCDDCYLEYLDIIYNNEKIKVLS